LSRQRIAIFGLEGHGHHLAAMLCRCRVGTVLLVDPFTCSDADLRLTWNESEGSVGRPREQVAMMSLRPIARHTTLQVGGAREITEETVERAAAGADMLVGCFDRAFETANLWINRASLRLGIPAIYSDVGVSHSVVGPLVDPLRSACYVCYRTRSLACEYECEAALAYQQEIDRGRVPRLHERGVPGAAMPQIAAQLCAEILKRLLRLPRQTLLGRVLETATLGVGSRVHPVLRVPHCSACGTPPERPHPTLDSLRADCSPAGDIIAASDDLVGRRTGVFIAEWPYETDDEDLARPFQEAVEIANHGMRPAHDQRRLAWAWGKGMTREEVRRSALGEAVERYSAEQWWIEEVVYAQRGDLRADSLDPRSLVLYAPHQYASLPYAPYGEKSRLGWVEARSLVTDRELLVPAIAVFTGYGPASPEEYLFPSSSNGAATGGTMLDAIRAALLEVLERDAFMLTWLGRLPCRAADPRTHPDRGLRAVVSSFGELGATVRLFQLPTAHPVSVFAAVAVDTGGGHPAAAVGLGADFTPAASARRAVLELSQVWHALRAQLRNPASLRRMEELAADPRRVSTLEDHPLYYAAPEALPNLEFLLASPEEPEPWRDPGVRTPREALTHLLDHFAAQKQDVIYRNLTPPDMRSLNLFTVRVIVPDFQPLHFGASEARLAGRRLNEIISRAGSDLAINTAPHPLG
jgi:ribosomal protein S12 methylthiotransferase accessory factor